MKRIAATFLIFIFTSCHEDENTGRVNSVVAKRNNVDWIGTAEIYLDDVTDTLTFRGTANRPNDEVLVMKIKFNGVGSYSLKNRQAYYYSTIGGDVLSSEYELGTNVGEMVITKYEPEGKLLEGTFEMSLTKVRSNPANAIDTYDFSDGVFTGEIFN